MSLNMQLSNNYVKIQVKKLKEKNEIKKIKKN